MRSFTVREFHDLIKILEEHPEWREELRRLILTDELLKLPEIVREQAENLRTLTARVDALAEDLRTLTARVDALTARVDALAEDLRTLTARVDTLTARVDALAEDLRTLTARVDALTEDLRTLTARVDTLTEDLRTLTARVDALTAQMSALTGRVERLSIDVADLKGDSLERRYRERAHAYFSRLIRNAHTLSQDELVALAEEALERGFISEEERDELLWTDVIVKGRDMKTSAEVYLVAEVSWRAGVEDVERASRRAEILKKLGVNALPVVCGKEITEEAIKRAREIGMVSVIDGRVTG